DGTGLGLSIVREVLSYHQATVQIESELGEGTTFIIQFSKL
ncbi:MAG: ATP-binding protein, partial [Firmicutes bacterium]|nr:ATP-binding protein [Bacillota bacterium]